MEDELALLEDYLKIGNFLFRYRSYIPLIVVIIVVIMFFFGFEDIITFKTFNFWTEFCFVISLIGICIRMIAVGFSSPKTSGRNINAQLADSLNTSGIYSIVRHPLYVGNYLIWLGISMRIPSFVLPTVITILYWIYYEKIMFVEEDFLRNKFGNNFVEWSNKTPAILPNIFLWKKPQNKFSWKKIIRKENDGIYAFLIAFYLIIPLDILIDSRFSNFCGLFSSYKPEVIILSISTIIYIFIKFLKKKTNLLK
jgi:protein-S-isoprenylcysteine O-methyltransferase Ste14